jgi:hypothetical protein
LSSKAISDQKALLEKSSTRKTLGRARGDSASLIVHRDENSLLSYYTDNLSKFSKAFNFDAELLGSWVYERAVRRLLKVALKRQHLDAELVANSKINKEIEGRFALINRDEIRISI